MALVEVFEVSVEHVRVLTNPFARLRNIRLKLLLETFHGIATRSQGYVLMHGLEKVALEPIGGVFVKTVLDIQTWDVVGRNIRLRVIFRHRLIVLFELYDFLRLFIYFRLECEVLLGVLILNS